jgi:hypothetical protein
MGHPKDFHNIFDAFKVVYFQNHTGKTTVMVADEKLVPQVWLLLGVEPEFQPLLSLWNILLDLTPEQVLDKLTNVIEINRKSLEMDQKISTNRMEIENGLKNLLR